MKIVIDIPKEVIVAIENGLDYRYDIHTAIAQGIPFEERPKGKWEYSYIADNNLDEIIRCSVCHRFDTAKYIDGRNPYCDYPAFCKRCGADMRGGM